MIRWYLDRWIPEMRNLDDRNIWARLCLICGDDADLPEHRYECEEEAGAIEMGRQAMRQGAWTTLIPDGPIASGVLKPPAPADIP